MHNSITRNVIREITPLNTGDCFTVSSRIKKDFDFPLHYHEEYELNLILNAKGAKRVVGDGVGVIDDMELVFIGPNIYHAWFTHQCTNQVIKEVTIQFHKDLFDETFLRRNQVSFLKNMFNNAQRGILFSQETTAAIAERILNLNQKSRFDAVLELLSILHSLSLSSNIQLLSDPGFSGESFHFKSRRIEKVFEYMYNNYDKHITLAEVARIANMPQVSFSRFIKKRTGKTFIESLNEIRLGHASRMLIDTNDTIAGIAYKCGFNNISNFNRTFKRKKLCIPREFRETYSFGRSFFI
ncbi:MAG TPA: AraC family transcriptional regulator [Mucilaginibacter sp.]|jgi:AraC-like DNA-binding protein